MASGNRVVVQEGYDLPFAQFDGHRRKKRRHSKRRASRSRQTSKMSSCAKKWRSSRKSGSYRGFMKRCLKT